MEGQKQEGESKKVEVGARNERVEKELEDKFFPFFWFFFGCFLVCFIFFVFKKNKTMVMYRCLFPWCYIEEGDGSLLPSPSFLCFKKKNGDNTSLSFFVVVSQ